MRLSKMWTIEGLVYVGWNEQGVYRLAENTPLLSEIWY